MISIALPFTATRVQASTYLLGVCLFSISFLVFLNSAVSFVITDRIGQKEKVGDAVGTLGFADELVALVACPVWGIMSDRVGVRSVAVCGYLIVGVSLILFVQATNVYPQLLLGRLLFSVGGAATSTMVTAILPTMTYRRFAPIRNIPSPRNINQSSHDQTPSISSELTITPARFRSTTPSAHGSRSLTTSEPSASQLAGIVGMLTGFGALVALLFFLRLPTRFQDHGISPSQAVADSFYVVGSVALAVAAACFFGLRGLSGEEDKGWRRLLNRKQNVKPTEEAFLRDAPPLPSYPRLLVASITLGIHDMNIGLGYVGGFVARASSVGISLFIPLFVNAYFIKSGRCPANPGSSPNSPGEIKENCARAYIVASIISGVSQLVALICAPIFGYLSSIYQTYNFPLLLASVAGIAGYATFGSVKNPDPRAEDGSYGIFFIAALLGISQIGAIVCSLGLLARGIEAEDDSTVFQTVSNGHAPASERNGHLDGGVSEGDETSHLLPSEPSLPSHLRDITGGASRSALKGSIAGVYSLAGGAGILLLTKVGGLMFDKVEPGSPFFLMAGFNAVLFATTLGCDIRTVLKNKNEESLGLNEDIEGDLRDAG
ncbi:cytochrome P450 [Venturia nashicola]|uniref:Cytochrome P450 n=1 Tax=Venturia nashicola TaxID=86259 RepID=A0A4Z1PV02_9PEZI|nr:cytochrome P450 [Venturia nashicola]